MFRQGFRRCAQRASSSASASMLLLSRPALSVTRHQAAIAIRPISSLKTIVPATRKYSTEASAEAVSNTDAVETEEVTKFRDLSQLGVHNNLLSAIVDGMGYESMTPVQAKTINPALKGTDM